MGQPSTGGPAARTSHRLALALLGYFILVTLVITLSPFDFTPRRLRISYEIAPDDMVANIALFLPLGFLLRSIAAGQQGQGWRAVLAGGAFSVAIECAQVFLRGRFVSPIDVLTNTCGAAIGVALRDRVERWTMWNPRVVSNIGLDVPLVGLLYLLLPQLWLSGVGTVDDRWRILPTLLLVCAGAFVVVSLHRHRWRPQQAERRFEAETLRKFLPVFVVYLVVAALWPAYRPLVPWHGALGFLDRLDNTSVLRLLLLLEQVGGFTLLGYALSEWRGREERSLAADLPRVTTLATVFALGLELVQGVLAGPGASAARGLLAMAGAMYGASVYHLARAHVRALREMLPSADTGPTREAA